MAHNGTKSLGEIEWQRRQYADGVRRGLAGLRDLYADSFYQRGYRRGLARRAKSERDKIQCQIVKMSLG